MGNIKGLKNIARLVYRILLIVVGTYGLYLNFKIEPKNVFELIHYYTILSNILVVIFFLILVINNKNEGKFIHVKGAVTMCITVTFLVFHFMLRQMMFGMTGEYSMYSMANLTVHYIIPIMVILDWLFLDKKGEYTILDPIKWLVIPLVYWGIMTLNGLMGYTFNSGSHYPYFFIDIDLYGIGGVLKYVAILIVFFTVLGYVFYVIDRLLGNKNRIIKQKNML